MFDALLDKMEVKFREALALLKKLEVKLNRLPSGFQGEDAEAAECQVCGVQEEPEGLEDGLCRICRQYPQGSYKWHLACYFDHAEPPVGDEVDAFRSGWLRALQEVHERLTTVNGLKRVIRDLEREAGL